jgi:hypothetical protein
LFITPLLPRNKKEGERRNMTAHKKITSSMRVCHLPQERINSNPGGITINPGGINYYLTAIKPGGISN